MIRGLIIIPCPSYFLAGLDENSRNKLGATALPVPGTYDRLSNICCDIFLSIVSAQA